MVRYANIASVGLISVETPDDGVKKDTQTECHVGQLIMSQWQHLQYLFVNLVNEKQSLFGFF